MSDRGYRELPNVQNVRPVPLPADLGPLLSGLGLLSGLLHRGSGIIRLDQRFIPVKL